MTWKWHGPGAAIIVAGAVLVAHCGGHLLDVPDAANDAAVVVANPSTTTSSIVATPSTVAADGTSTSTLTVTVKDGSGNPLGGRLVTLSASGTANTISPPGVTDASGRFVATLASTHVEKKTVTASFDTISVSTVVRFVCAAHGTFAPPIFTPVSGATALAIDDIDVDGKLDVAVVDGYPGAVHVLFGKGGGTFDPSVNVGSGDVPNDVIVADLDGDTILDLATANAAGGSGSDISVMRGLGNRTFADAVHTPAGYAPWGLAAGDFNADKIADIAVADWQGSMVTVLLGADAGSNQVYTAAYPAALVSADFNRDGKLDLATANESQLGVSLALGNGDGTFAFEAPPSAGEATSLVTADFDEDGKPDIATVSYPFSNVGVLLGNGDGTFKGAGTYQAGYGPSAIATADYDGDGHADLAIANYMGNTISILFGKGDGTFQGPVDHPAGAGPHDLMSGDFNGDGSPDIAIVNLGTGVGVMMFVCP